MKPQPITGPSRVRVGTLLKTRQADTAHNLAITVRELPVREQRSQGMDTVRACPLVLSPTPSENSPHSQPFGPPRCSCSAAAPSSDVSGKCGTLTDLRKKPNAFF